MTNDATKVLAGKPAVTGGALTAPLGATLPTTATATLDAAFLATGYVSDAGVVQTIDATNTDIKAWGGDVVRRIQTAHVVTYKLTLIETNVVSTKAYYGASNVTETGSGSAVVSVIQVRAGDLPHGCWALEMADAPSKTRVIVPDGQVTDRGTVNYTDSSEIGYEVTITAYPDSAGVKAYIYRDADGT